MKSGEPEWVKIQTYHKKFSITNRSYMENTISSFYEKTFNEKKIERD